MIILKKIKNYTQLSVLLSTLAVYAEYLFILCITFFSIFVILDFQSGQQCGSWSDGFFRSKLMCIHSVFNKRIVLGSAGWGFIHYNRIKLGRMRAAVWTARLALFAITKFIHFPRKKNIAKLLYNNNKFPVWWSIGCKYGYWTAASWSGSIFSILK